MERRNHARVAVNITAALLDEQAMPMGCRVRDVSKGGMLLQHEPHNKTAIFHEGDTVKVRLSLKQEDERKVIPLSTTVKRVQDNGIGVEFVQPQSQLMELVEPYRLDKEETRETAAYLVGGANPVEGSVSAISEKSSARASRRRFAIQRARAQFAETMKTTQEPVAENERRILKKRTRVGPAASGGGDRRLYYIGLLSLAAAVGILLFNSGNRITLENRISALESTVDGQVNALTILRARLTPTDNSENALTELNARLDTLTTSFAALETRIQTGGEIAALSTTTATNPAEALSVQPQPVDDEKTSTGTLAKTPATEQPQSISDDGPWVINLVSLYNQPAADQFTEKVRAQGIRADNNRVSVKGRDVWRVQVSGFSSRDEASAYGDMNKEKLGLDSIWIFKNRP